MANIDLNISPYFDDFDPNKDYLKVLFRPGFPVQARELTTLQSFMQNQIARFGNHVFKDGSKVTSGGLAVNKEIYRIFLSGSGNSNFPIANARTGSILATIGNLEGKIITNNDGTVRARVISQPTGSVGTSNVGNLYFQYLTVKKFTETGDYIYATISDNTETVTTELVNTFSSISPACVATVEEGIYFVNGNFSRVPSQTVIISTTSHTPSAKLGFSAQQTVITQNDDSTLYDNARGSTNEGAPGSHRLRQNLTFVALGPDTTVPENFYLLAEIKDGNEVENKSINSQYNDLGKTLARRTFDESGNYFLKPFALALEESDSDTFVVKIGPSKAYVYGYEVEKTGTTSVYIDKDTSSKRTNNFKVPFDNISSYGVLSITGTLPGQTGSDPYTYANRLLLKDSDGDTIGVARGYSYNSNRLYIYDVKMFQVITTNTALSWSDGNDAYTGRNTGYVYNNDGQAGIAGNAMTLINWSGAFRNNQVIKSTVQSTSATIQTSQIFKVGEVSLITGAGGFEAYVDPDSFSNPNPELVYTLPNHIKTLRGTATVFDNDFTILDDNGLSSSTANGYWNESRVDDQEEIEKKLKFKYLKIKNTGTGSARTGVNFGWSAQDSIISLAYPDVNKVYGISLSTDSSFSNGQFTRIEVNTTGLVPMGSIIEGISSGTKAVVALQNTIVTGAGDIASTTGYHSYLTGTGSNTTLEVIYRKNTSFTAGETLKVTSPAGTTAFTSPITYTSATAATGKEYTANYMLDNGQRSEFYDVGRLVLKKGNTPPPSGDIIVFFSYFEASPLNNFFYSADSYSTLPFYEEDVRFYSEPKDIIPKIDDTGRDLRNSIDFRFRVSDQVTDITQSPLIFTNRTFYKQPRIKPSTYFTTDMEEFLTYILSISLNIDGGFDIVKGQGVVTNPAKPSISNRVMPLYHLTIPPAVRYPEKEIAVETVDNKRYTMKDIGKIEDRVNRLEESVALSLLESQALHDDLAGRSKSGFVTDDFSLAENNPNSSADYEHPEYNASVDVINNELIPGQTDGEQIEMQISSTDNIDQYYLDKNIIIKQYNEVTLVEQLDATECHKVNPFATWVFIGDLTLTPDEHHWRDRINNYFTNFNGQIRPFSGDSDQFSQFLKITTASPGGASTSRLQWTGATFRRNLGAIREIYQARQKITTTTFGAPRVIAGSKPTETYTGTQIIQNITDYWMRNPAGGVNYSAEGLRPNTSHRIIMGDKEIATGLISDGDGKVSGNFNIPYQTFKAGRETVQILDEVVDGRDSRAAALFTSVGHKDFYDITAPLDNKRVETQNLGLRLKQRVRMSSGSPFGQIIFNASDDAGDPIAQAFKLPVEGTVTTEQVLVGDEFPTIPTAIITSCDVWLCYVDTRPVMDQIIIEIRKMINGYPGGPGERIGTTGRVKIDKSMEVVTPTPTNYTRFRFTRPVEIRDSNEEYCIVIKSPSDATEVFTATLGKQKLDGSGTHSEQPNVGGYFGSFFVSQNQTTWSAEQSTDLMFRLNRADFDVNNDGSPPVSSVTLKNTVSDLKNYKADIGAYNRGLAIETFEYSNYVKVYHPNHGMHFNNAQVKLMGFDKFGTPNNYNGIPDSELNGTHDVLYATLNTYFIKTTTKATSSGRPPVPIFDTFATQPIVYDSFATNVLYTKDEADDVRSFMTTAETNSLTLEIDSNKIKNSSLANVSLLPEVQIPVNEYVESVAPFIIRNNLNATTSDLTLRLELDSGSRYSSPILVNNDNLYPFVYRNIVGKVLNDSEIELGLTTTSISSGDGDSTLQEYASYISAVESENEFSAYVTKQIDLEIPADGFTLIFEVDMEPTSKLEFAYKARQSGDTTPFDQIDWTDFKASKFITEASNGPFTAHTDFKQYKISQEAPFEFTSFKIRIRMSTEIEALVPKIRELRVIADL